MDSRQTQRFGGMGGGLTAPVPRDIWILLAVVFATFTLRQFESTAWLPIHLQLSPEVWERGFLWQLVTYAFVGNARAGLWLVVTLLILYMFAGDVRRRLGKRGFWQLLVSAVLVVGQDKIDWIKQQKSVRREPLAAYANEFSGSSWHAGEKPWSVPCDMALPCATQNEMNGEQAATLLKNGCKAVSEGANMPVDLDGVHIFKEAGICYAPGKAANAGGVAVSGLEMSQNSARLSWSEEQLQQQLRDIMKGIHDSCAEFGDKGDGTIDYVRGANIAGFVKVADAMIAYGVV